jgi:hypothetical protein
MEESLICWLKVRSGKLEEEICQEIGNDFNSYISSLMKQRLNADFTNASGGRIIFLFSHTGKKVSSMFSLNPCLARV